MCIHSHTHTCTPPPPTHTHTHTPPLTHAHTVPHSHCLSVSLSLLYTRCTIACMDLDLHTCMYALMYVVPLSLFCLFTSLRTPLREWSDVGIWLMCRRSKSGIRVWLGLAKWWWRRRGRWSLPTLFSWYLVLLSSRKKLQLVIRR